MNPDDLPKKFREDLKKNYELNRPGIERSEFFLMFTSGNSFNDAYQTMCLGMAIMMDKPIIVLADQLEKIPQNLRKIAVVVDSYNPNEPERASKVVKHALERARVLVDKLPKK